MTAPAGARPTRVLHVIGSLDAGGTEQRLLRLVGSLDRQRWEPLLCCIDEAGALADRARELGVEPVVVGRRRRLDPGTVLRLVRLMRRERPAIVHTWLDLANFFGRVASVLASSPVRVAVEAGRIRGLGTGKRLARAVPDFALAQVTDCLVANSHTVAEVITGKGIPARKVVVIPNGVPLPPLAPRSEVEALRARLGLADGDRAVGMVSRFDPEYKDHPTLLRAFALIRGDHPRAVLVLVGDGAGRSAAEGLAAELEVDGAVVFTGFRDDAQELVQAFDVSVLCSFSEGFPNAVLEAMACARPVVATDLPANREAIDDGVHGLLVPPEDVAATAAAITRLLDDGGLAARLGHAGRDRVAASFSLAAQAQRTSALYERLLAAKLGGAGVAAAASADPEVVRR